MVALFRWVAKSLGNVHAVILLVPLRESGNSAKLSPAPLPGWVYVNSFDTAKECREEGLKQEQSHAKDPLEADQYGNWECIATDDPRLSETSPHAFEDHEVMPTGLLNRAAAAKAASVHEFAQ
jgi:hypothetical protein